jgi:PKD repeat protein
MQKTILFTLYIAFSFFTLQAQEPEIKRCISTEATNLHFKKHPALKQQFDAYQASIVNNEQMAKSVAAVNYTIPVVFHILHLNGTENISDVQVMDAMTVLNNDFAKKNADTVNTLAVFQPIAKPTNIRFQLAKLDPNGNCTSGIIRHLDTDANWDEQSPTLYQHTWDPSKYLNVYVVKSITLSSGFGAAGYTYLPGSWSYGAPEDAIVMLHTYTGNTGTSNNFRSHVLTHEVGHWLNLLHVFGWNACGEDCNNNDFVNDTPNTPGYLNCPTTYDICNAGVPENYQNFMDYSYCNTMFTNGQVLRMNSALQSNTVGRANLVSNTNMVTTGINPAAQCAPAAFFKSNKQILCVGQTVSFTDESNIATPTNWNWVFEGGTPNLSSVQNPTITYNSPGTYSVQLVSSNSVGNSLPETKIEYITVLPAPITGDLIESFETATIPNATWTVKNVSSTNTNWQQTNLAAATGNKSVFVSENAAPLSTSDLYTPTYDFSSMSNLVFTFKWAGAERDVSTTSSYDFFNVYVSTNCGLTWTPRFSKSIRSTTAGVSGVVNGGFIPTPAQFNQEMLNIAAFTSATNVLFRFRLVTETGLSNNFYLDDINIVSATNITNTNADLNNLLIYPNPSSNKVFVNFELVQHKNISVVLYDVLGKTIKTIPTTHYMPGNQQIEIPVMNLDKGIYVLSINTDGVITNNKIIID